MKVMITGRYAAEDEIHNVRLWEEMKVSKGACLAGHAGDYRAGWENMWSAVKDIVKAEMSLSRQRNVEKADTELVVWIADKIDRIQPETAAEHCGMFAVADSMGFKQYKENYDEGVRDAREAALGVIRELVAENEGVKPTFRIAMAIGGKLLKAGIPFEDSRETPQKALNIALQTLSAYISKHPECRNGSKLTVCQDITRAVGFDARKELAEKWGGDTEFGYELNPAVSRNLFRRVCLADAHAALTCPHLQPNDFVYAAPESNGAGMSNIAIYGRVVLSDRASDTLIIDRYQSEGQESLEPITLPLLETELSGVFRQMQDYQKELFFENLYSHQCLDKLRNTPAKAETYRIAEEEMSGEEQGKGEQLYEAS